MVVTHLSIFDLFTGSILPFSFKVNHFYSFLINNHHIFYKKSTFRILKMLSFHAFAEHGMRYAINLII